MNNNELKDLKKIARQLAEIYAAQELQDGYEPAGLHLYEDAQGNLIYFRIRLKQPETKEKWIRPFHFDAQKQQYVMGEPAFPKAGKPLYHLPQIARNVAAACPDDILIVEGETCVEAAEKLGLCATTSGGSGSVTSADLTPLQGQNIRIFRDNDTAGLKFATEFTKRLLELNCCVRQVDVANLKLPEGGDIVDWLRKNPSATKENILALSLLEQIHNSDANIADHNSNVDIGDPEIVYFSETTFPEVPIANLPDWLKNMVREVARFTETPVELALMLGLSTAATCIHGKFFVSPKEGYREPLNIWTLTALESGNRKSAVLNLMTQPLYDWERQQKDKLEPEISKIKSEIKTKTEKLKDLRKDFTKGKNGITQKQITELELDIESTHVPRSPRLWAQDVTPEQLGVIIADNNEKMAIISAEGGIFDMLAGRYTQNIPNLDVFLQAHAGDRVRVDRVNRDSVFLNSPALTFGLSPQPCVLSNLANQPDFRGRGLLARFLYCVPKSNVGHRKLTEPSIPPDVLSDYAESIITLLNNQIGDTSITLTLSVDACNELLAFSTLVEKEMRDRGKYEHIRDWAGKLPGVAARLAGIIHCAKYLNMSVIKTEIDVETINQALELAAFLQHHALYVFDLIGADPVLLKAKKIWQFIERNRLREIAIRELHRGLRGHFKKVDAVREAVEILVEHGYLIDITAEHANGRPSERYRINDRIVKEWDL